MVAGLILLARLLGAQVSAVVQLHQRDAEITVANPTARPLRIDLNLYRDAPGSALPLGDSIPCRISPRSFTLRPGGRQVVRLRLAVRGTPGALLRLTTTFTPMEEPTTGMRFVLATRIITRVEVQ